MRYVGAEAGAGVAIERGEGRLAQRFQVFGVDEPSAVLGARIGACVFNSFTLPAILWALGGLEAATACAVAAVFTLLSSRTVLVSGGARIAPVLLFQIVVSMLVLYPVFGAFVAFPLAVFVPLGGSLLSASVCGRIADVPATDDEVLLQADAAVARAMQPNVVDIRSASANRRANARARARAGGAEPPQAASGNTQGS